MSQFNVAYISYVCDQNEPSRPKPAELTPGSLKDQLEGLFVNCFDPEDDPDRYEEEDGPMVILIEVEIGGYYGDVKVYDKRDDESLIFVTFKETDLPAALEELGLEAK